MAAPTSPPASPSISTPFVFSPTGEAANKLKEGQPSSSSSSPQTSPPAKIPPIFRFGGPPRATKEGTKPSFFKLTKSPSSPSSSFRRPIIANPTSSLSPFSLPSSLLPSSPPVALRSPSSTSSLSKGNVSEQEPTTLVSDAGLGGSEGRMVSGTKRVGEELDEGERGGVVYKEDIELVNPVQEITSGMKEFRVSASESDDEDEEEREVQARPSAAAVEVEVRSMSSDAPTALASTSSSTPPPFSSTFDAVPPTLVASTSTSAGGTTAQSSTPVPSAFKSFSFSSTGFGKPTISPLVPATPTRIAAPPPQEEGAVFATVFAGSLSPEESRVKDLQEGKASPTTSGSPSTFKPSLAGSGPAPFKSSSFGPTAFGGPNSLSLRRDVNAPTPTLEDAESFATDFTGNTSPEESRLVDYQKGKAPFPKFSSFRLTSTPPTSNHTFPSLSRSPSISAATSTAPLASTSTSTSTNWTSLSSFPSTSTTSFFSTPAAPRKMKKTTMDLLGDDDDSNEACGHHEIITAPMFSQDALDTFDLPTREKDFPQFGVFGRLLETHSRTHNVKPEDPRLFFNTNAPLSTVICGVQGSGKSHSVSLLLETMFIQDDSVGQLREPLAGSVFHFGEGGDSSQPCEAAFIASCEDPSVVVPKVVVYVSPASFVTMRTVYNRELPKVEVYPIYLSENELTSKSILAMLGIGTGEPPLYITTVKNILLNLGEDFTYQKFLNELDDRKTIMNVAQVASLEQRMNLLDSFLDSRAPPKSHACQQAQRVSRGKARYVKGQLTIVDLSDPFIDASQACSLFDICLTQFVRARVNGAGKVLLLDEAHKYMSGLGSSGSARLTQSLLSVVRQQRHLGMRVVLATQEPTVVAPALLSLTSIIILHRFSSSAWWKHLTHHLGSELDGDAFDRVVTLKTGNSIVICPAALGKLSSSDDATIRTGGIRTPEPDEAGTGESSASSLAGDEEKTTAKGKVGQLGRGWMLVKGRKRLTVDGGKSVLAV